METADTMKNTEETAGEQAAKGDASADYKASAADVKACSCMKESPDNSCQNEAMPKAPRENARTLNAAEIAEILPHRYPFALIDRVLDYEPGKWAIARKCVSVNEGFFQGHFPGNPIMPGVLILEALAQTGAVAALSLPEYKGKTALFGGVKNARFKKQVIPGDVLELRCQMVKQHGPLGIAEAEALVDGKTACRAELTFAIS